MKKVAELVFIPAPGVGHLIPKIEFAKRLLDQDDRFSVTVLAMQSPLASDIASFTESLAASDTRSSLSCLMLYLPTRHDEVGVEFEESDNDSIICTYVNPVPTSVLPSFVFNKHGGYTTMMNQGRRYKETKGIIVNTFVELESHAVNSLLNTDHLPPVYTIGPIIDLKGKSDPLRSDGTKGDKIMKWLDNQPPSSVVFLCFGSMGSLGEDQVKEIAVGLEQSGNRFLWSLRKPPPKDKLEAPTDYTHTSDIQKVLPNGFLERTKALEWYEDGHHKRKF